MPDPLQSPSGPRPHSFFLSYRGGQQSRAQDLEMLLQRAGHTVFYQYRDFAPGQNFLRHMDTGAECDWTIAILTADYFSSEYTCMEWKAALARDRLIPLKFEPVELPPEDQKIAYVDLRHLDEWAQRQTILKAVNQRLGLPLAALRVNPETPHNLPGRPPRHVFDPHGHLADLWGHFSRGGVVVGGQDVVVHGFAGAGKSLLSHLFAWNHLRDYSAVLVIDGTTRESLRRDLAKSAEALGLGAAAAMEEETQWQAVQKWLRENRCWLILIESVNDEEAREAFEELVPAPHNGAVLITSRLGDWEGNYPGVGLRLLDDQLAADFLLERAGRGPEEAADALSLAREIGGLAAHLEIVARDCRARRMSFADCLARLRQTSGLAAGDAARVLWEECLQARSPAALRLLETAAFFGTGTIDASLFASASPAPERDESQSAKAIEELAEISLIELDDIGFRLPALLSDFVRSRLTPEARAERATLALSLCAARLPDEPLPEDSRAWKPWAALRSHLRPLLRHAQSQGWPEPAPLLTAGLARYLTAIGCHAEADVILDQCPADSPHTGRLLEARGILALARRRFDDAVKFFEKARELAEARRPLDELALAATLSLLGDALSEEKELTEAIPHYERALALRRCHPAACPPEQIAETLEGLALLRSELGEAEQAEALAREAIGLCRQALPADHPEMASAQNNLATVLLRQSPDHAEAGGLLREALATYRFRYGDCHPVVATALFNLAAHEGLAPAERLDCAREAWSIRAAIFGGEHPAAIDAARRTIEIIASLERSQIAREATQFLALARDRLSPDHECLDILQSLAEEDD